MKKSFKDILTDKITGFAFWISLLFIILSCIIVFLIFNRLPPFIPIFNQMPWGIERIGGKINIFIPLISVVLIFFTNSVLASFIYNKTPLISRILSVTSLILTILVFLFVIKINFLIL